MLLIVHLFEQCIAAILGNTQTKTVKEVNNTKHAFPLSGTLLSLTNQVQISQAYKR